MKKTFALFFCISSLTVHASYRDYYALSTANQSIVDNHDLLHTKRSRKSRLSPRHIAAQMYAAQPQQQKANPKKFDSQQKSPFNVISPDFHDDSSNSFKTPTSNVLAALKSGRVRFHSDPRK